MLIRPKVALAIGLSCATSAALAGGALAHGGGGERSRAGIEVKVRGLVTELTTATPTTGATITVSPGGTLDAWTCALREGADTTDVVAGTTTVALKCRTRNGVLTAKRIRPTEDTTGKVKVKATGLVTAFTPMGAGTPVTPLPPETPGTTKLLDKADTPADPTPPTTDPASPATGTPGSITIDAGTDLPSVTCAVTDMTRLRGTPVAGTDMAKVICRSRDDVLVAKKIKVKGTDQGKGKRRDRGDESRSRSGRHGGDHHKGDR